MANQNIKIQTRYNRQKSKGTVFDQSNPKSISKTQQQFKDEADIVKIVKRFQRTGLLTDPMKPPTRMPQYGDFSGIPTYQQMCNMTIAVNNYFQSLSAEIRYKFHNDPQELQEWLNNPENTEEAIKMGLADHDLSKVKYHDPDGNDITDEIVHKRGLYVKGLRVNPDGSPYKKQKESLNDEENQDSGTE